MCVYFFTNYIHILPYQCRLCFANMQKIKTLKLNERNAIIFLPCPSESSVHTWETAAGECSGNFSPSLPFLSKSSGCPFCIPLPSLFSLHPSLAEFLPSVLHAPRYHEKNLIFCKRNDRFKPGPHCLLFRLE